MKSLSIRATVAFAAIAVFVAGSPSAADEASPASPVPESSEPICVDGVCYLPADVASAIARDTGATSSATAGSATEYVNGLESCEVLRVAPGFMDASAFAAFIRGEAGDGASGEHAEQSDILLRARRIGGWPLLVVVLLCAGAALNLTPCVLPLVPVFLAMLGAGSAAASASAATPSISSAAARRRGAASGVAFGAGMAVAFGALGLMAVRGGRMFGAWQGMPWFHVAIGAAFAFFALASLDVFTIDLSRLAGRFRSNSAQLAGNAAPRIHLARAFALGAISAALGGACVAPVLASALVLAAEFSAGGRPVAGALVPLLVGVGMGLPWPALGAGMASLPRPGRWMVRVKWAYAAIFFALAAWQFAEAIGGPFRKGAGHGSADSTTPADAASGSVEWLIDEQTAIAVATALDSPILLELSADWCRECQRMERETFPAPEVAAAIGETGAVALRIDCTDAGSPEVRRVLKLLKAPGLPFAAMLAPKNDEGR